MFSPVLQARPGTEIRTQQEQVGDAILLTMNTGVPLIAEAPTGSGKSFAVLVPLINAVRGQKPTKTFRGVIATANNTLLKQYEKDLSFLETVYPGFKWASLMGRNHYYCEAAATIGVMGDPSLIRKFKTIQSRPASLGKGERADIEKLVGELTDHEWSKLTGSSQSCYENSCTADKGECYSSKARAVAQVSHIVVTNYNVLQVNLETDLLGEFTYLFCDEAHEASSIFIDSWTERLTEWELNKAGSTLVDGVVASMPYVVNSTLDKRVADSVEGMSSFITNTSDFFQMLHPDEEWDRVEDSIRLHWVKCDTDKDRAILHAYEVEGLAQVQTAKKVYAEAVKHLETVIKNYGEDMDGKTRKTVKKGFTAAKTLSGIISRIETAMQTKGGTIVEYGVPYAVVVSGRTRRNGDPTADISVVPLDISTLAKNIWTGKKVALLSATLRDMTDGTFRYAAASLGIGQHNELIVTTPFDYSNVQKVYVTPGQRPVVPDVRGARYSFEEMVDLIHAARGRTLVLFTSRVELEDAAHRLNKLIGEGKFPYPLLIQWADANKKRLAEDFISSTDSVLLGLSSFFQGFDVPGESLSQVLLAKYPLPRYDAVCKQQIAWWRGKGFPEWYSMRSMETFRQASGRLIRSKSCRGIVGLLDQRAVQEGQTVRGTAIQAVQSLGSVVTQNIDDVKEFLK